MTLNQELAGLARDSVGASKTPRPSLHSVRTGRAEQRDLC